LKKSFKKLNPADKGYTLPSILESISSENKKLIAVLPGSRKGEVKRLGELFIW